MVRGLVLRSGEASPTEARQFEGLEDYQAAVGGWIEPLEIPALKICLYLNEEGRLKQLPFNARATLLLWFHVPELRQKIMLVGDVVVVGQARRGGRSIDVPREVEHVLDPESRFAVDVRRGAGWVRTAAGYPYMEAAALAIVIADAVPSPVDIGIVSDDT